MLQPPQVGSTYLALPPWKNSHNFRKMVSSDSRYEILSRYAHLERGVRGQDTKTPWGLGSRARLTTAASRQHAAGFSVHGIMCVSCAFSLGLAGAPLSIPFDGILPPPLSLSLFSMQRLAIALVLLRDRVHTLPPVPAASPAATAAAAEVPLVFTSKARGPPRAPPPPR
jgi:hypothetical protein